MDNNLLLLIFLFITKINRDEKSIGSTAFFDYIKALKIEPKYTLEKIQLLKKIGPYFPEEYIPTINKSIFLTERIIKINELANFMKNNEYEYIKEPVIVENNKERVSKILNIVQKEGLRNENNNYGMILDLAINMEKYKKMFSMLNSIMSNKEPLKEPSQLLNLIGPIMGIDANKDNEKLKEINRMIEIMKVLNSPKKENVRENKNEIGNPDSKENHLEGK